MLERICGDFWMICLGDFWRICGCVLECCWYIFGGLLGTFWMVVHKVLEVVWEVFVNLFRGGCFDMIVFW